MSEVTRLLEQIAAGDRQPFGRLFELLYHDLRRTAQARMNLERTGDSFQASDLVHETYMRLVAPAENAKWDSRGHFFAVAAKVMRRILVDRARSRDALKRGGNHRRIDMQSLDPQGPTAEPDVIRLDDALTRLAEIYPDKVELIELRFFGGLSLEESAQSLGISASTAKRSWKSARAWLLRQLEESP